MLKWKMSLALLIAVIVGVSAGWVSCRFVSKNFASAASLIATNMAVEAFEGCKVEDAVEYAIRASVLDPDSTFASSMLADFRKRKEARLKACADHEGK